MNRLSPASTISVTAPGIVLVASLLVPGRAIAQEITFKAKPQKISENKPLVFTTDSLLTSESVLLTDSQEVHNFDEAFGHSTTTYSSTEADSMEMASTTLDSLTLDTQHRQISQSLNLATDDWFLAQETAEPESNSDEDESDERPWRFELTPYFFTPLNVQGTSTVDGITSDVDLDLDEILDILSFAASGRFEAWYGNRLGLIFEGSYLELNDQGEELIEGPAGLLALNIEADVTYEQAFFDFAVALRTEISDRSEDDPTPRYGFSEGFFDVIAGLRVQHLNQDIDLDFELSDSSRSITFDESLEGSETWVEPLLGARVGVYVAPKLTFGTRVDVSGFGIDGLSLTFRGLGGLDWMFAGDTSLKAGYQLYIIDVEDDGFGIDQTQHGPYLAVTFRF